MAAKLLHSLADENPDLQKQIGCMTGILQLFDRQHILSTGKHMRHRRLPPGISLSEYALPYWSFWHNNFKLPNSFWCYDHFDASCLSVYIILLRIEDATSMFRWLFVFSLFVLGMEEINWSLCFFCSLFCCLRSVEQKKTYNVLPNHDVSNVNLY